MSDDVSPLIARVPEDVLGICRRLREKGKRGWIVGGCVRDLMRGREPKDWDIATDALPKEVVASFRKVIPTGIQHGTVTVVQRGGHYEVTTLRGEGAYSDGRRPDAVEFVNDITADLARRDFTFNAMAIDPVDGQLIDPFSGKKDLDAHVLRAVGVAEERFAEDGLRVLRAARFSATLQCTIDPLTERAMGSARSLDTFRRVSAERVRDEWMKAMSAAKPSVAFEAMRRTQILGITCPEMVESVGCAQNKWHTYDVWGHAMACLDACVADPVLRVAALLHDVGKPRTRAFSDKTHDFTFYEHERIGAEMAEPILTRLRFSNEERAKIVALVRHHLICYEDDWTDAAVRRWIRRVTPELAPDLYQLGFADARGKGRDASEDIRNIERLRERVGGVIASGAALSARDLAINGKDLMTELELKPGRVIGETLEHLVERVTDEPELNDRAKLLAEARLFLAGRGAGPCGYSPRPDVTGGQPMSNSLLNQLKAMTVTVADTGDINSIQQFKPRDATTNPSLITAAAQMPEYHDIVDGALRWARTKAGAGATDQIVKLAVDRLAVEFGLKILQVVERRVSTEVDARLSFDTAASIEKGRYLISLYEAAGTSRERILIKIASTWEGIRAAEVLEKEGIHCNLTLLFGMHQAVACAEAGVTLISPFVGRILDWYKKDTGRESYPAAEDPGVVSVGHIYDVYKKFGYKTEIMGASFRNVGEILELAGCDLLTISPQLLAELDKGTGTLVRKLDPAVSAKKNLEKLHVDEATFRAMHEKDRMAKDKLAEGIAGFSKALVALEKVLADRLHAL